MGGISAAILILATAAVSYIQHQERAQIEAERARTYIDQRKDMDNADVGEGDAAIDRDWLRDAAGRLSAPRE